MLLFQKGILSTYVKLTLIETALKGAILVFLWSVYNGITVADCQKHLKFPEIL